jgi:ubiquinone/menaquinone biosynthesis C-methylase UbiE
VDEHKLAPEERAKLALYRDQLVAASYDQRWRGGRGRARDQRKQRAIATALALLGPAKTILDVPCGTGRFTGYLSAAGLEYTGGDASLAMLTQARTKHESARFAVVDLARLPYPDRAFDVALCIRLMHLVRDRELRASFLRELARVARVGVIVDFRQDKALRVWLGRARAKLGLRAKPPGALALEKIHAELEAAGLEVVASIPVRKIPYLSDKIVIVAKPRG